jgi:DDE superfamily endonuclease
MVGQRKTRAQRSKRMKKNSRTNGLLAINLSSAEFFFQAKPQAKSEHIAAYFANPIAYHHQHGARSMDIFLDRNTTHKEKMKRLLEDLRAHQPSAQVDVRFHLMPAYLPKLNPVEYAIHLLRLRYLYHADSIRVLPQVIEHIAEVCKEGTILSKQQINNIIRHIIGLVKPVTVLSPKREYNLNSSNVNVQDLFIVAK